MIANILSKIFGTANSRTIKKLQITVDKINALEEIYAAFTTEDFEKKTKEFKFLLQQGATLNDILPDAYALAREAAKRTLNMRPFDVQLMGAIALHQGKIAEMKTGEGKTLTATLALYLNALEGKGAHLVTVNDYLARRDAEWNKPIYDLLGVSVGVVTHDMNDTQRKIEYQKDILYATNSELGFDYLRDNMKFRYEDYTQRALHYAIVDECDSILIDEARTPLIISGPAEEASKMYITCNQAVKNLQKNIDYELDEKTRNVQLTEDGHDKVESFLQVKNLYAIENINLLHHIIQALKAHVIFKKDVDYVVRDGQVLIVDEFTGRILSGRRYSDGLHQAIEAKEHVEIEQESQTLASITLQNFFRMYGKLAGMTGTAATESEEFANIYKLDIVSIPTNKKMIRKDQDDIIFLTENGKFKAIVADIIERHKKKQPVLIGTIAVEKSEELSLFLTQNNIPHEVLNAKNHAREAEIIAKAGDPGNVTIATNMAGRGTDIKLNPESLQAGGLYVLGTERHESRRIDNQLRGRSGRQGDPGESRFYISLEDNLIRIFAGDSMKNTMQKVGMKDDEQIESKTISKLIENAQEKVEKNNYESRKHLLEYDDVLNQHRNVIYSIRFNILKDPNNIPAIIENMISSLISFYLKEHETKRILSQAHAEALFESLAQLINEKKEFIQEACSLTSHATTEIQKVVLRLCLEKYKSSINKANSQEEKDALNLNQKWIMLETIDEAWKQHMVNIDSLKEGIGLRGWGQKNPLLEYKKEAFIMFSSMMQQIQHDILSYIFRISHEKVDAKRFEDRREKELKHLHLHSGNNETEQSKTQKQEFNKNKIGRNDICSCGSGKKFKKCCG